MDFSINMKTKHVSGVCACGNTFDGVVPEFVEVTQCDDCILAFQEKRDKERRIAAIRDSAEHCGIPSKFRNWDHGVAKELGSDKLLDWMRSHGTKSMWIGGTNGVGKTHTVLYRAYEVLVNDNIYSYCVRCSSWLRDTVTGRTNGKDNGDKNYRRAIRSKLLVLDDLGKERLTEPRAELLYDIIDDRDRLDLPIWITTNFGGQELLDRMNASGEGAHEYGFAIMKRLTRMITKERIWK